MSTLDRKVYRDLARLRGQVFTIALVLACGIASYVALKGTFHSLRSAQTRFYARTRFADVFVDLKAAPASRVDIESVAGVSRADPRLSSFVTIPLPEVPEPVRGKVVSLPHDFEPLNAIVIREGRRPMPGRNNEAVVLQSFAAAHGLRPDSSLDVVMNQRLRTLTIVGTATSPEYVLPIAPGTLAPDASRFAVLWMNTEALEAALDLRGAFNTVTVQLTADASRPEVLRRLDDMLAPYGSLGAIGRDKQLSHHGLEGELQQLQGMATVLPTIFLGVAALLVSVVLSRVVQLQQSDIAMLKAIGYGNAAIMRHFFLLVSVVGALGCGMGLGLGRLVGAWLVRVYSLFFRFLIFDSM